MRYGLALGSNAGPRRMQLQAARDLVFRELAEGNRQLCSSIYETDPVDCEPDARSFYNSCIEFETSLDPEPLLERLQEIEHRLGRPPLPRPRNAPRTIDLDVLYGDRLVLSSSTLTLPHPLLHTRRFVLEPLAEIQPNLVLPGQIVPVSVLLNELECPEEDSVLKFRHW